MDVFSIISRIDIKHAIFYLLFKDGDAFTI